MFRTPLLEIECVLSFDCVLTVTLLKGSILILILLITEGLILLILMLTACLW